MTDESKPATPADNASVRPKVRGVDEKLDECTSADGVHQTTVFERTFPSGAVHLVIAYRNQWKDKPAYHLQLDGQAVRMLRAAIEKHLDRRREAHVSRAPSGNKKAAP